MGTPTTVWNDRIAAVLADPKASRMAAMMYYLTMTHVNGGCSHKRTCPERLLVSEVELCVKHADRELESQLELERRYVSSLNN